MEKRKIESKNDLAHQEEWEVTRSLYSQLYLTSTMQNLLLQRLEPRFRRHEVVLKHEAKYKFVRARKLLADASKLLEESELEGSCQGRSGDSDFVMLNTALNREGYHMIRCMLAIQNATRYMTEKDTEMIVDLLNQLTTGKHRIFAKKLIDTFKLEEDKK